MTPSQFEYLVSILEKHNGDSKALHGITLSPDFQFQMTTDEDSKIVATAICKLLDLIDPNTVESLNFCNPLLFGDRKAPQAVVTKLSQILPLIKNIPNVPQLNFITKLPTENQ